MKRFVCAVREIFPCPDKSRSADLNKDVIFGFVCCVCIGRDCQCEVICRGVLMFMLQYHIIGKNLKLHVNDGVIFA